MGNDVKQLLQPIQLATVRNGQLLRLQQIIEQFNPDELEQAELLDTLGGCLRKHRGDDACEALLHLSMSKNALERLSNEMQIDAMEELEALQRQINKRVGWQP